MGIFMSVLFQFIHFGKIFKNFKIHVCYLAVFVALFVIYIYIKMKTLLKSVVEYVYKIPMCPIHETELN